MLNRNSYFRSRLARAALVTALVATGSSLAYAQMEEDAAAPPIPPYALLQYSTLTGSGNTVTAIRVPVVTATGTTYKNVVLQFAVGPGGNLTVAEGYPKVTVPVTPLVSGFRAGKYVGPSNVLSGGMTINVNGPAVTNGGATEWSLAAGSGANSCTYPASATWYVGPITSNPLYPRLKAAGITSTAWSYGVIGGGGCYGPWESDTIIGVSQIGNALTIVSFTENGANGVTKNQPFDEITYRLTP